MYGLSRVDQLLNDAFGPVSTPRVTKRNWLPEMDIRETETQLEIDVELPGVPPENVEASVTGNVLTIKGLKDREIRKTDEEGRDRLVERSYGSFARKVRLPVRVDPETAKASAEHGIVKLRFDKLDVPKRIDIPIG